MHTIIIPLNQFILNSSKPFDLSAIPKRNAVELIKSSYGFLSPAVQVEVTDGMVELRFEEASALKIGDALKQYQRGVKEAQLGNYGKAVGLFSGTLYDIWKKRTADFASGNEYEIVDEFAYTLKLAGWFEWRPDAV